MAMSPDQWLARLTKAMDKRAERLAHLRRYMNGDAPLPEGAEGCREAYASFQKKARTNFGELIVDAVVERMIPSGFSIGGESEDDDRLRVIWTRNRLQIGTADVVRDMVGLSAGYMIVGQDPDATGKKALITCERPEQVITDQSPTRPDQVRAALKVYRDDVEGFDVAYLHLKGEVHTYFRPLRDSFGRSTVIGRVQGDWQHAGPAEQTGLKFIPVFPFLNRGEMGEFESHTDILDRINWNILQRLVITAMQAYRQRGIEEGDDPLPDEDEDGNEIDYAEMFKPGAGSLWRLPKGAKLWESAQTDITAILTANKDDITHLGAVTRTPMPMLIPSGANQSAEGAHEAKAGLLTKAKDRIERAKAELALVMGAALAIETGSDTIIDGIESLWKETDETSLTEKADAASKAHDLPWRTRMTYIWGFTEERVDQMELERAEDALNASLMSPPPTQVTERLSAAIPPPVEDVTAAEAAGTPQAGPAKAGAGVKSKP
jgi:Phage portal protein, SPP1 Gp6-like